MGCVELQSPSEAVVLLPSISAETLQTTVELQSTSRSTATQQSAPADPPSPHLPSVVNSPSSLRSPLHTEYGANSLGMPETPVTSRMCNRTPIVTPESIKPYPVAARVSNDGHNANHKKRKAVIATSSPFKAELLADHEKKTKSKSVVKRNSSDLKMATVEKGSGNGKRKERSEKNSKKMTCRADKRRGRKPKAFQSVQKTPRSNPKSVKVCNGQTEDVECVICSERYSDSLAREQWIQCLKCKGWCHEQCTNGESSTGFVCDFCT